MEEAAYATALSSLHDNPDLTSVLGRLLTSDVGRRRALLAPLMQRSMQEFRATAGNPSAQPLPTRQQQAS
jgi:hypothetical protein